MEKSGEIRPLPPEGDYYGESARNFVNDYPDIGNHGSRSRPRYGDGICLELFMVPRAAPPRMK
jgi:hypothetical protein